MERRAARLVCGGGRVSEGVAGAGGRAGRNLALWGRTSGISGRESATDCGGGNAALGVERGRAAKASKRAPDESEDRAPVAAGDDHDLAMDRGSFKDGDMDPRCEPASPSEELSLCQYSGLTRLRLHRMIHERLHRYLRSRVILVEHLLMGLPVVFLSPFSFRFLTELAAMVCVISWLFSFHRFEPRYSFRISWFLWILSLFCPLDVVVRASSAFGVRIVPIVDVSHIQRVVRSLETVGKRQDRDFLAYPSSALIVPVS